MPIVILLRDLTRGGCVMSTTDVSPIFLDRVMSQRSTPVAVRRGKGHKLIVQLPCSDDNKEWLRHGKNIRPVWPKETKRWELPQSRFNDFVERTLRRYPESLCYPAL